MDERKRFERIYSSHYDEVLRYCLRRSPREDALDAAADTFTVAWRRRADLPEDNPVPWLYGVARRVIANQWRSSARRQNLVTRLRLVDVESPPDPERQLIRDQDSADVVAAMNRLRPADQEVIRLAGWEELGRDDIGLALGCTPNAVTKRLNGALDRLARELGVAERSHVRFFNRKGAVR